MDASHHEVEARFRMLLDEAGLPAPDRVEHDEEAGEVVFFWDDAKAAVVVEITRGREPPGLQPPV